MLDNITLVHVPIGMTGEYQPLDITINEFMARVKMKRIRTQNAYKRY